MADSRWEAVRLRMRTTLRHCHGGERLVRRDVRWYPATSLSRRRCAAVVYTFRCLVPGTGGIERLEQDRLTALQLDADPAIERDCGEKDPARRPPTPPPPSYHQPMAELLSSSASCRTPLRRSLREVAMKADTRLQFRTLIHPSLAGAEGIGMPYYFVRSPRAGVEGAFNDASLIMPNMGFRSLPNNGTNIIVTQVFAPNPRGQGYCIRLTARQGSRIWQRQITRPELTEYRRGSSAIDAYGRLRNRLLYWTPATDARLLATAFGAHLARESRSYSGPLVR